MKWKRVTIFISSTFNDMHAERDYLVKDVFPELREWCEKRKIHLVDIDLRWGVSEEDSNSNNTVLACLHNIDDSRPFFLCFLGQRRGWIPGEVSPETLAEYPDVEGFLRKHSVTEIEIEHALLSPMRHIVDRDVRTEVPAEHALFYFRDPGYLPELSDAHRKIFTNAGEDDERSADNELERFKNKIRARRDHTTVYQCGWNDCILSPELLKIKDAAGNVTARTDGAEQGRLSDFNVSEVPLKDVILQQLKDEIVQEFPDRKEEAVYTSALERDLEQQALFAELNSEGYIYRAGDFEDLNDYISGGSDSLFVLTAPAGYGKSMLLANFIKSENEKHNARVFGRFCGASDLCAQQFSLWKTIFDEANVECPDTLKDIKDNIGDLLEDLGSEKTVLIIDAVDQLPDGTDMGDWLPKKLPENLKIILSMKDGETLKKDEAISYSHVKPFKDLREKEKLIKAYLKKYLKALDETEINTVCALKGSENPLYLKILLSELRVFGSFDQLIERIRDFGETPKSAFSTVLGRLEQDVNSYNIDSAQFAAALFGLLANARNGLSEPELEACIHIMLPHIAEDKLLPVIRLFLRQVKPFMARREGRVDFFYEAFKLAAQERYGEAKIRYNEVLAGHFMLKADPGGDLSFRGMNARDFNELPYHLYVTGDKTVLERILQTYLWVRNKSELTDIFNTISDYAYADCNDIEPLRLLRDTLSMSAHVLSENVRQNMPAQLWGRLKGFEQPEIRAFLQELETGTDYQWLKPRHFMQGPGGALLATFTGHTDSVNSVCASEESRYIISGSEDKTIRVWDLEKQREAARLTGHPGSIYCVDLSRDGRYIVSCGQDDIRVWDLWSREEIRSRKGDIVGYANCVCFSFDGRYIASVTMDGEINVWDWERDTIKATVKPERDNIFGTYSYDWAESVCFSPDGRKIIVGSQKNLVIWDWENETKPKLTEGDYINSVCCSPDGRYIATGCGAYHSQYYAANARSHRINILDLETSKTITLEGHKNSVESVCFSDDGLYIASGSSDSAIRIWTCEDGKEIALLEGHTGSVMSVCFSTDGHFIISGSKDRTVRIWNWRSMQGQSVGHGNGDYYESFQGLRFSRDGRYFAAATQYPYSVRVWEWETEKEIANLGGYSDSIVDMCFSYDSQYIVTGANDKTVRVWDFRAEKEAARFYNKKGNVFALDISCDDRYIAVVSGGESVYVWDWKTSGESVVAERFSYGIDKACFCTDGKSIAFNSGYGTISVWDYISDRVLADLPIKRPKGTGRVMSICCSNDGQRLAVGMRDAMVQILDLNQKEERSFTILHKEGFLNNVGYLGFTGNDRYIIAMMRHGIYYWDWGDSKEVLCIRITETEKNIKEFLISYDNTKIVATTTSPIRIISYDVINPLDSIG